jgi:hypothetical protein
VHLAAAVSLRRVEVSYRARNSYDKVLASSDLQQFALPGKQSLGTQRSVFGVTTSDNPTFETDGYLWAGLSVSGTRRPYCVGRERTASLTAWTMMSKSYGLPITS